MPRPITTGWSQEDLGLEAGINRTYIGSLEAGERNPSLENIARLAVALGVEAADLSYPHISPNPQSPRMALL